MTENKHGFQSKQEITVGGIAWTIIQTGESWVKCIASKCVEYRAFDEENKNDFAASSLRAYLNGEFLQKLIDAGAPEAIFKEFVSDLTADNGLKQHGTDSARIGLITCDEYRALRENIPPLPNDWWWTATPDSPINNFVRYVSTDGALDGGSACYGNSGVRPLCVLQSEILKSYLDGGAKQGMEGSGFQRPLSLNELREMGGKPYWHVGLQKDSPPPHWNILDPFYAKHIEDYGYGKRWIAYRSEPDGEEEHGAAQV